MSRLKTRASIAAAALLALAAPLAAADWPQWRGPHRDGKSAETGLLASWPEGGPRLAWKAGGLGVGYSTVSVADGRIFTVGDVDGAQQVLALSEQDGKLLWKTPIGKPWEDADFPGPRSTPTVDGALLYVTSTDGDVVCLESATGKKVWSRSLPKDFGGALMLAMGQYEWRWVEAPLVDGDRLIVTPGAAAAALVALDKKTGKEIWRTKLPPSLGERGADGAGYSAVVISNGAGVKQYVQLIGRGLIGVEAATGKLLWHWNRVANNVANIPTAIVDGDYVFAATGYETGGGLLKLRKEGSGVVADEVYFLTADTMQNHHGGMVLVDGHVYLGTAHNRGFPLCLELATGKVKWGPIRNSGTGSGAVVYADGHLVYRYQNGTVILVEATPAEYREKGSFVIPDVRKESWPHPVISNGKLYLREQETLYVYAVTDVPAVATPAKPGP